MVKYIVDHPRFTLQDVVAYLKDEYKLEVSVKTIERELEEHDLSDLSKLLREKEKRTVHVNYAMLSCIEARLSQNDRWHNRKEVPRLTSNNRNDC